MILWTAILAAGLVGFDGWITLRRVRKFGPFSEANPAIRQLIEDYGEKVGVAAGVVQNLTILGVLVYFNWTWALTFFAGVKFGLALLQLKSLQMETYVERVLAIAQKKKLAKSK